MDPGIRARIQREPNASSSSLQWGVSDSYLEATTTAMAKVALNPACTWGGVFINGYTTCVPDHANLNSAACCSAESREEGRSARGTQYDVG